MGAARARIPPELAEQFERLGEPVVIHRLTRFDDPTFCRAAREWLAEREAARRLVRHNQELASERQDRRRTAILTSALILSWVILFAFFTLLPGRDIAAPEPELAHPLGVPSAQQSRGE
ncbi:MAG TPA: hypothetical protein VHM01_20770 [Alphaproteobacteria bacterium]|nr:hypothetical protein [Alphaproteobacteria bacterium]